MSRTHRSSPPSGEEQRTLEHLSSYVGVVFKRKWTVLLTLVAVVAGTLAYTSQQVPIYRATATVIIDTSPPRVLSGVTEVIELGSSNYWAIKDYLRTQYEIIRSRDVAERVVDRLGLRAHPELLGVSAEERSSDLQADLAALLLKRIRVEPLEDSLMVFVHVEDAQPAFAMELADAFAFAYRDQNLETKRDILLDAQRDLLKMVGELRKNKETAEADLQTFEREQNIGSFDNQKKMIDQQLSELNAKLAEVAIRRVELEAKLTQLERYKRRGGAFSVAYAEVLNNPLIVAMKQRYVELEDTYAGLSTTYLEKHPKVTAVREQMNRIEREIRREVRNLVHAVEAEHEEVVDTEAAIRARFEEAKEVELRLSRIKADYDPIMRRYQEAVRLYEGVLARQAETTLSAQSTMNNVRIHDRAAKPERPVRPNWRLATIIAVLLGLLGGVGLAFLREFVDNSVRTREDIERAAGLTFLGVMPRMGRRRAQRKAYYYGTAEPETPVPAEAKDYPDLFVHFHSKSEVAERTRNIRTNLLFMMPEQRLQTVLITSPNPAEGKTTVALNVAIIMAQAGSRTLLVDTDLRRPRVHQAFSLERKEGVSSVVMGESELDDAVKSTFVPKLDVLCAGPIPPDPTALLHSKRFAQLMGELRERYDVVILDSPPVLPVTDAMIIATHADGVLVVARSEATPREALALARHELETVNATLLGAVLNEHEVAQRGYGGYKYYRHRYVRKEP